MSNPPPVVIPPSRNNIIINPLQRGNPVLECIRNVGKEFGEIVADYQVGRTTGVLYLSLKYHRLHPEYIPTRIEKLGHSYTLRILLILCDVTEHKDPIRELTKSCLINNITVIVAFSFEEVGHYLSTFKQFEHKPPDMIKERVEKDHNSILRAALTTISRVNKTDVETLRTSFGSFSGIASATSDQLQNLPGFGQVKIKNIKNAFEKPFKNKSTTLTSQPIPRGSSVIPEVSDSTSHVTRPRRESSPEWDIELDLNKTDTAHSKSPEPFDIELDLN
ncbi:restriction endonuclease type II-like protein [Cyathus striatus]|nr:restriction endonuclease type II-like protein [Cyathus striatus]